MLLINMDEEVSSRSLIREYNKLQRTPSGAHHAVVYRSLEHKLIRNEASFYSLLVSLVVADDIKEGCFSVGVTFRKGRLQWADFFDYLRLLPDRLPERVNNQLEWNMRVRGW